MQTLTSWGSTIPLNIKASDDGTITKVEFFANNEFIGVAEDRYLDVYSFDWQAQEQVQGLVYATVTDDQNNTVRTGVKEFNFGTNLGKKPSIEAAYLRKSSRGSHEIRVILRNIVNSSNPYIEQENNNVLPYRFCNWPCELRIWSISSFLAWVVW